MPPDKPWKAFERRVAKSIGGRRRGTDHTDSYEDVEHSIFSVECKLLAKVSYADFLAAAKQSERNAPKDKIPIAILKKKQKRDSDALVVMRYETFLSHINSQPGRSSDA